MSKAKVGIVVGVVFIGSALGIYGCSHVHIQRKDTSKSQVATTTKANGITIKDNEIPDEISLVTETKKQTEEITTTTVPETTTTTATTTTKTTTTTPVKTESSSVETEKTTENANGVSMRSVEEPELSGEVQTTTGEVVDKCCLLSDNNQIVYLTKIKVVMGLSDVVVDYYCTYSTYSSLKIGDKLSVVYQSVSGGSFVITNVTRQ